jgi:site-specific recombinase XerD
MPSPRLLDQVRDRLRVKHYSMRTKDTYFQWIRRIILFHGNKHPRAMLGPQVEAFLSHLAKDALVAASTQNRALAALLFLYREVLQIDLRWMDGVLRAKRPKHAPTVLTANEVHALLAQLEGTRWLVVGLLYSSTTMVHTQFLDRGGRGVLSPLGRIDSGPAPYCQARIG